MTTNRKQEELARILKCGTVAFMKNEPAPLIEMDMADTMAVLRFAQASQIDLNNQVEKAASDTSLKPWQFKDIRNVAATINNWLNDVIATCHDGLKQMSEAEQGQLKE